MNVRQRERQWVLRQWQSYQCHLNSFQYQGDSGSEVELHEMYAEMQEQLKSVIVAYFEGVDEIQARYPVVWKPTLKHNLQMPVCFDIRLKQSPRGTRRL